MDEALEAWLAISFGGRKCTTSFSSGFATGDSQNAHFRAKSLVSAGFASSQTRGSNSWRDWLRCFFEAAKYLSASSRAATARSVLRHAEQVERLVPSLASNVQVVLATPLLTAVGLFLGRVLR